MSTKHKELPQPKCSEKGLLFEFTEKKARKNKELQCQSFVLSMMSFFAVLRATNAREN